MDMSILWSQVKQVILRAQNCLYILFRWQKLDRNLTLQYWKIK
jgi:hypothetical protein